MIIVYIKVTIPTGLHMPTFDSVIGIVFEVIGCYLLRDYVAKYNSLAIGQKWLEEPSFSLYDELIPTNKKAFSDLKNKVAANKMILANIKFCTKRQYGIDLTYSEEKGKPIQLTLDLDIQKIAESSLK